MHNIHEREREGPTPRLPTHCQPPVRRFATSFGPWETKHVTDVLMSSAKKREQKVLLFVFTIL